MLCHKYPGNGGCQYVIGVIRGCWPMIQTPNPPCLLFTNCQSLLERQFGQTLGMFRDQCCRECTLRSFQTSGSQILYYETLEYKTFSEITIWPWTFSCFVGIYNESFLFPKFLGCFLINFSFLKFFFLMKFSWIQSGCVFLSGEILFPLRSALLLSELNNEGTHFISNTRPFVSTRPSRQIKQEIFVFFHSFLKCLFWKDRLVCQEQNFSNILKTFRKDLGQKSFCSLTNRKTLKLWFYK